MEEDDPPSTSSDSPDVKPSLPSPSSRRRKTRRDRHSKMEVEDGEKESQTQYCKGFFDALRVVQNSNKFEFNGVTSPVLPPLGSTTAFSPITPATASDMHTIVMSILGNTPIGTGGTAIPTLSSPTLLPLVSGDIPMDDLSMKLLASSAIPGPPIISSSNSPDSSTTLHVPATNISAALPPLLNNFVSSTTASTSRPDKLNLTPPRQSTHFNNSYNNSDDSDGGFEGAGRGGADGMSMDDQEKKKLERKRARNRQAASKCRQKKMDRIKELEDQVNLEKHRSQRLDAELAELNRALHSFRSMVERHSSTGCPNSIRA